MLSDLFCFLLLWQRYAKGWVVLLILLVASSYALGQARFPYHPLPDSTVRIPLGIIKFAPLSLMDPYNTIQVGFEYLPREGIWGAQLEAGYGNYSIDIYRTPFGERRRNKETWRFRSELRLYTNGYVSRPLHFYIAAEYFYKRSNWENEADVGRECESGVCAYFERIQYRMHKDVLGVHAKVGWQETIAERLLIDMYGGVGIRHAWVHSKQYRENDFWGEEWRFINVDPGYPGRFRLFSMALGFKVGYLLYR